MEDVFDTTGTPPKGWIHAQFDGGPYGEDVGRCVPGPPPPDSVAAGSTRYVLRVVGSWSDPDDPVAIYGLRRRYKSQHPLSAARWWFGEQSLMAKIKVRSVAAKLRR